MSLLVNDNEGDLQDQDQDQGEESHVSAVGAVGNT